MLRHVLCAVGLLLFPLNVFGQGTLLWEVQEKLSGNDVANAVLLSGKVAIVAGRSQAGSETEQILQGLSRTAGTLKWDLSSEVTSTQRVASYKKTLYIDDAFGLTAYDGPKGTLLWRVSSACCDIVAGPTAVVTFAAVPNTATGTELLTTAYDPKTGTALWENRERTPGFNHSYGPGAINQN